MKRRSWLSENSLERDELKRGWSKCVTGLLTKGGYFKCNIRRIADYPNLFAYMRDLYQTGAIASTFRPAHIKNHYYQSHVTINPTGLVPVGPVVDFSAPHRRG